MLWFTDLGFSDYVVFVITGIFAIYSHYDTQTLSEQINTESAKNYIYLSADLDSISRRLAAPFYPPLISNRFSSFLILFKYVYEWSFCIFIIIHQTWLYYVDSWLYFSFGRAVNEGLLIKNNQRKEMMNYTVN